ncbi:MAG TPA: RNA polymerase subunit sigma-24, partial [Bacteroidales bacterium]
GDLSFKEIADMTQVSLNTALGRMRYALINLRKLAEKHKIILEE